MKFSDFFVPRWQHSKPEVRKRAVEKLQDVRLLQQIAEKDEHPMVRDAAAARMTSLKEDA